MYKINNNKTNVFPIKDWASGDDPRYTYICVEGNKVVCAAQGNHYAGCACEIYKPRPDRCTGETALECAQWIYNNLSQDDKKLLGGVYLQNNEIFTVNTVEDCFYEVEL